MKHLLKPKVRGKALRDKKKRSGQEAYQREQLGDGFIDNPPLISAAKSAALALADDDAGEDEIAAKALELASEHPCDDPLTDDQMKTLNKVISDQIAKHLKLDRIEAKILDEGNKNLYFMYGKIKRKVAVGDTIELGMNSAVELCKCSKSSVTPILKKLEKLGKMPLMKSVKRLIFFDSMPNRLNLCVKHRHAQGSLEKIINGL